MMRGIRWWLLAALVGTEVSLVLPAEAAELSSLTLAAAHATGCLKVSATVTLTAAAPPGGLVIALSTDSPLAAVPASVTIKAGAVRNTFRVVTTAVALAEPVTVVATLGARSVSAPLVLDPMPPKAVALSPTRVVGGAEATGTVTLPCAAGPGDVVVALSSSRPAAARPVDPTVTVPQGNTTAAFVVTTAMVGATTKAVISARANGVKKSSALTVGPQIAFEDRAAAAGIAWSGNAGHDGFSVAWTDADADGWPDLWSLPHNANYDHARLPSLHVNRGDGTFADAFDPVWMRDRSGDTHGSNWADFDNDGHPDAFVSVGAQQGTGAGGSLLFVNRAGVLTDEAVSRGVDYPLGRGRASLWFDWNLDGRLDLLEGVAVRPDGQAPPALFVQEADGRFVNATALAGLAVDDELRLAQLADLSGDGRLDVVVCESCAVGAAHTPPSHIRVFEANGAPLRELTAELLPPLAAEPKFTRDVVVADFDNDLRPDILLTRSTVGYPGSTVFQGSETVVGADFVVTAKEVGIAFRTPGAVYLDQIGAGATPLQVASIFIGASGRHPATIGFTVRPDDPAVAGLAAHVPGVDRGLYVGYDTSAGVWQVRFSSPDSETLRLIASAVAPVSDLTRIGFAQANIYRNALPPVLLRFDAGSGRFVDRTAGSGLDTPILGQSAVAGDFDNDMDVDILVSGPYTSFHDANLLYQNRGDGTFTAVPGAGGAAGRAVGPHTIEYGLAARLAVADYDRDGFLDVFSGPTNAETPTRTFLGEPPQLFRNLGNGNHWIEIDLVGTQSNRDGIGARVLATAGGLTQLREQGGGMHHFAQDHMRLHFGLAANRRVQRLEVRWPSGVTQVLTDVAADQVLRVVEPAAAPAPAP